MAGLPPDSAILTALEAFLDAPQSHCIFLCEGCHAILSLPQNLIQDLRPFSGIQLLFDSVSNVVHGASDPILDVYIGEEPDGSHVDLVAIHCSSCGLWVGWKIIEEHEGHPLIHPGQFVLVLNSGGVEVTFFE